MKKSIMFKPYDGMAAKVGDVVYSAYIPGGENKAASGKVVYTTETEFVVDWGHSNFLATFTRVTAERHLSYGVEQFLVNGFEVPAPLEKDPGEDQVVYAADPTLLEWYCTLPREAVVYRPRAIARGLAHDTAEAAIAHAKAMAGVNPTARKSLDDAYDNLP